MDLGCTEVSNYLKEIHHVLDIDTVLCFYYQNNSTCARILIHIHNKTSMYFVHINALQLNVFEDGLVLCVCVCVILWVCVFVCLVLLLFLFDCWVFWVFFLI